MLTVKLPRGDSETDMNGKDDDFDLGFEVRKGEEAVRNLPDFWKPLGEAMRAGVRVCQVPPARMLKREPEHEQYVRNMLAEWESRPFVAIIVDRPPATAFGPKNFGKKLANAIIERCCYWHVNSVGPTSKGYRHAADAAMRGGCAVLIETYAGDEWVTWITRHHGDRTRTSMDEVLGKRH